jgi:hypothetical protein
MGMTTMRMTRMVSTAAAAVSSEMFTLFPKLSVDIRIKI